MKINSLPRGLLCLLVLLVLAAGAAHGQATAAAIATSRDTQFCSTIETRADAAQSKISARQETVIRSWQSQTDKEAVINKAQDSEVQQLRAQIDTQRALNMRQLNDKAANDTQKAAVQNYVAAVASAVSTRRAAVDEARSGFRTGVKNLVQIRQAAIAGQVEALRIGVSDSYTTAKTSCGDGQDPAAVRTTLVQSLTAAKQAFLEKRTSDPQIGQDIARLSAIRAQTVKGADTTFLQTTSAARQTLRDAFAGTQTVI
jgi:hypothetical protein